MSLIQPIMNLEKTSSIPQGSTFVVEMGDGSGTKAVTKENLEKSTGEALKIGNLEELQTENKTNIVAAINEAAQSGGSGTAVDILDTKEEIEANTETGKAAGALAVQEMFGALNDKLEDWKSLDINLKAQTVTSNFITFQNDVLKNAKEVYYSYYEGKVAHFFNFNGADGFDNACFFNTFSMDNVWNYQVQTGFSFAEGSVKLRMYTKGANASAAEIKTLYYR